MWRHTLSFSFDMRFALYFYQAPEKEHHVKFAYKHVWHKLYNICLIRIKWIRCVYEIDILYNVVAIYFLLFRSNESSKIEK